MAKKERFPLKMANDVEVRNIDDFKAHFDIDSVTEYFFDGRLLTWLEDRYYDYEADAIRALNENDDYLAENLCAIFDVETEEEIVRRKLLRVLKALLLAKRLNRLKKYTDDKNILASVDNVAFEQEELAYLLDEGVDEIYLCANRFVIPLRMKNKNYIGVGKAIAVIRSKEPVDFDKLNIKFKNIFFDDYYQKLLLKTTNKNTQTTKSKPFQFIDQKDTPIPPLPTSTNLITAKTIAKDITHDKYGESSDSKGGSIYIKHCSLLSQKANSFKSKIQLCAKGKTVDAKSILMIISMGLLKGTEITIIAEGEDAKEAVDSLKQFIDNNFGEE